MENDRINDTPRSLYDSMMEGFPVEIGHEQKRQMYAFFLAGMTVADMNHQLASRLVPPDEFFLAAVTSQFGPHWKEVSDRLLDTERTDAMLFALGIQYYLRLLGIADPEDMTAFMHLAHEEYCAHGPAILGGFRHSPAGREKD